MTPTETPSGAPHGSSPDGFTTVNGEQKKRTDELSDGSPTGNATEDPRQDTDTASGGEPDDTAPDDTSPTKPADVDPKTGTGPDGTPVENPSG